MDVYEKWERRTTAGLTCLAVVSLVNFVLGLVIGGASSFTDPIDYAVWAAFAVDYLVRLYLVDDRRRFVRTHPVDLLAVVVPAVRALRVIAVLGRVAVVAQRSRSERLLIATTLVALALVLTGAGAVLGPERGAAGSNIHTYADAVWWALTTVTTVGYGDRFPVTPEGRVVGGALMVIGIGTMGVVTAALSYRFIADPDHSERPTVDPSLERIEARLDELTALMRDHARRD